MTPEQIGFMAALMIGLAFTPQSIKIWRQKSANEISYTSFIILQIASFMMIYYGLKVGEMPVVLLNILISLNQLFILGCKFFFSQKNS